LEPGRDIQIQFTGLRPGEKLFEELSYPDEKLAPTAHPRLLRAPFPSHEAADKLLAQISELVEEGDSTAARAYLAARFPMLAPPPARLP
jgi:FlaA1/EpsC-like NDP-sugar epimerase